LFPTLAQAEETMTTTSVTTTSEVSMEVDMNYVENFKTNFSSFENPYKVIDEDFKNGKINKVTWKTAWEYIASQKKVEVEKNKEAKKAEMDAKKAEYEKAKEAKKAEMDAKREEVKKKVEDHKAEMDKKKEEMKKMVEEKRGEVKDAREEWKAKHQELIVKYKEAFKAQIEAKLATATPEQLEKILGNIEKQVQKVQASKLSQEKKDKLLAQLHALKELIQSKLDTQMSDEVNLDDLLKTQ
jgi:chromosome segregation ATPase